MQEQLQNLKSRVSCLKSDVCSLWLFFTMPTANMGRTNYVFENSYSYGSPASQEVVNCARGLKALGTKEVILTHCINIRRDIGGISKRIEELIKPDIMNQKRLLEEQGFATRVEMVLGSPHIEINRLAIKRNCSAIIIGSIGSSTWGVCSAEWQMQFFIMHLSPFLSFV